MSWLIAQSLPPVLLAIALGLLLGWLIWGTSWNKVRTTRREVLGQLVFAHQRELADRDGQLAILREELDTERAESHGVIADLRRQLEACQGGRQGGTSALVSLTEPVPDVATTDNLQRIEGIGPKMAAALRAANIHTFATLAETPVDGIQAAVEAAGLRFAPSLASWSAQARLLAAGDDEAFRQLTSRLVAGRQND